MQGKALIRDLCTEHFEWDEPLPEDKENQWMARKDSVELEQLHIQRPYVSTF